MDFSLGKSFKSHNSYKHLRKLSADKSNNSHEHLPMLFHHHDDSMRAVDLSDHREEVIVKIDDRDSSAMKASETSGKIWRENSYEFWKGQDKSGFDFVRRSNDGGSQNSNTVVEEEKDPPSKLIK